MSKADGGITTLSFHKKHDCFAWIDLEGYRDQYLPSLYVRWFSMMNVFTHRFGWGKMVRVPAIFWGVFLAGWLPAVAMAQTLDDRDGVGTLREFVVHYLDRHADHQFPADPATMVAIAKTAFGPEDPDGYVIYIRSGGWCGSGGCHMLFVTKVDNRFEPLGFVCCIDLPVSIKRSHGAGSPEFIVSARGFEGMGSGERPIVFHEALTRRGDNYDFSQPKAVFGSEGPPEDLLTANSVEVSLY